MPSCPSCRRPVAVARASCLYCGAPLAAEDVAAALSAAQQVLAQADPPPARRGRAGAGPRDPRPRRRQPRDTSPAPSACPRYEAGLLARRGGLHLLRVLDAGRGGGRGRPARQPRRDGARRAGGGGARAAAARAGGPPHGRGALAAHGRGGPARAARARPAPRRQRADRARAPDELRAAQGRLDAPRRGPARPPAPDRAARGPSRSTPTTSRPGFSASGSARLEIDAWIAALEPHVPRDDGFRRLPPALAPAEPEPAGPLAAARRRAAHAAAGGRNGDGPRRARAPRQRRAVPLLLGLAGGRRAPARARPAAPVMSSPAPAARGPSSSPCSPPHRSSPSCPRCGRGALLAPGEGAALHLPLRVEVFRAWSRGELPTWNASVFSGTPLLAAYRPGALHPLMAALAPLPPLDAFQALVLVSLALTGPLVFLLARRLGAGHAGAALAALGFALGPYLVAQLGDTATLVAAPALLARAPRPRGPPRSRRAAPPRPLWPSPCCSSRSPARPRPRSPPPSSSPRASPSPSRRRGCVGRPFEPARATAVVSALAAAGVGVLLAAPQLLPTLVALAEAGPGTSGAARGEGGPLGGVAGLVVRSISHSPAAIFALAAVPLVPRAPRPRALVLVVAALLAALAARGPPRAAGRPRPRVRPRARPRRRLVVLRPVARPPRATRAPPAAPRHRRRPRRVGRPVRGDDCHRPAAAAARRARRPPRPRPHPLLRPRRGAPPGGRARLPAAAARVVPPAAVGPRGLDGTLRRARSSSRATPTREALDRAMGGRAGERTLERRRLSWPSRAAAADLAWANAAVFAGRRNVNGYDPLVPASRRARARRHARGRDPPCVASSRRTRGGWGSSAWGGCRSRPMRSSSHPTRSASATSSTWCSTRRGPTSSRCRSRARPRCAWSPSSPARRTSSRAEIVAECVARLASGREVWLPIRAGVDTAEWAWDRPDVRVGGAPPQGRGALELRRRARGSSGHQYRATLRLPGGPFAVTSLRFRAWPDAPAAVAPARSACATRSRAAPRA